MDEHVPDSPEQTFTWIDDESVSMAVIRAVASVKGVEPSRLEPLYDAVDPDALDTLFDPDQQSPTKPPHYVEFDFDGHRIRISDSGRGYLYDGN